MSSIFQTRRRAFLALGAGLAVLLLAAQVLARSKPPPRQAVAAAIPTAARATTAGPEIVVDVVGAVRSPGLYRLAEGSRVADAVARAGGPTAKAFLEGINMAAPLADGLQVIVPRRGEVSAAAGSGAGASAPAGPVHLNTATAEQLDLLPGVGPVTAEKIVAYRQEHGSFRSVDELDAIPGIGSARIEQLRDLVMP